MTFVAIEFVFHGGPKQDVPSSKRSVAIQLEVLNGTGEPGIAQKITNTLRSGGFDVVDMGNYKSQNIERTLVIARTANMDAAKSVASFLGLDEKRILQQPDKNLYLDVSVVIGKDIRETRTFR